MLTIWSSLGTMKKRLEEVIDGVRNERPRKPKIFLGIEILRSRQGIFINQKYILDLLAETGMLDCKLAETLIVANHTLQTVHDGELADKEQYQKLVGKLIYLCLHSILLCPWSTSVGFSRVRKERALNSTLNEKILR